MNYSSICHESRPVCLGTDLINQLRGLFDPGALIVIQNRAGAAGQTQLTFSLIQSSGGEHQRTDSSPLKLDLTLQVLEQDEVLQQNVPSEVAVAELQVHELQNGRELESETQNTFIFLTRKQRGQGHNKLLFV